MSNRDTGSYIARLRRQRGITQQQLADELGVTNKAVSKWETGQGMPDISLLPALATALGTSIDAIVRGGVVEEPPKAQGPAGGSIAGQAAESASNAALPAGGQAEAGAGDANGDGALTPGGASTGTSGAGMAGAETAGQGAPHSAAQSNTGTAGKGVVGTKKTGRRLFTLTRVAGGLLVLAGLGGAGLLVAFRLVTRDTRMEYLFDLMPYLLAAMAVLLVLGGLVLALGAGKKAALRAGLCGLAVCAAIVGFGLTRPTTLRTQLSLSPNGGSLLVLKHNDETGHTSLYRQRYGVLAKLSSDFPYTVNGEVKTQWLAEDICAVTYQSPDGSLHQFVATYGQRSGSDNYVMNALHTTWQCSLKNDTSGWGLEIREGYDGGIVIHNAGREELYKFSDCVQFGTLALALCRDGLPQWTVALNDDVCIDPVSHIAMQGSSITLCEVSMGKTMPIIFTTGARTASEPEIPYDKTEENREYGKQLREQMRALLKDDPTLASLAADNAWDGWQWSVETDADDIFEIARLAFEKLALRDNGSSIRAEYQITGMRLVAEGEDDWLVEINSRLTASSATETETVDIREEYRIMRAEGDMYLVASVGYSVDGTVGLRPPDVERAIETDGDERYHFICG